MASIDIVLKGVDQASGTIKDVSGNLGGLASIAGGIAAAGLAAAAAGAVALAGGLSFCVAQALEGEKILTRLDSVIRSTGGAAGLTTEMAQDLATRFMDLAGGSDDVILAIQEMALRMGTISAQQMPDFIQTTLDMAAATGVDAVAAARLLAQAQEDPISSLTRFRRMGILFSEDLEKQIKVMQESGNTAGAMALIMDRLGEATAGSAAAAAGTMAGQWEIMKGRMGEAAETIGMALLPVLHDLFDNIIAPAIPIVEALAGHIADFFEGLASGEDPIGAVANLVWSFAGALGFTADQSKLAFEKVIGLRGVFDDAREGIQPLVEATQNLGLAFAESMPMIMAKVGEMAAFVQAKFEQLSPMLIANVSETLNQLATFWREHGDEIMFVVGVAWQFIVTTVSVALNSITGAMALAMQIINGDWEAAWETIKTTITNNLNLVLSIVGTNLDEFIASWTGTFELAQIIVTQTWTNIKNYIAAKLMEITGSFQAFIIDIINKFRSTDWGAVGRGIIDGIKTGIYSAVAGLVQAAVDAALSAFNAAKAALGISSPSKLFASIGANMMQGMAQGINQNAGVAASAMVGAVSNVTNSAVNSNTYNYYGVQADMEYGYQQARAGAM